MKNLIIFIGLLFVFCMQAFAQDNSPCPKISVKGPDDLLGSFERVDFKANVEGANLDKISYEWTVSIGKIIEGQGTSIIKVTDKQEQGGTMTATVEIAGLLENCPKTASASANWISDPPRSAKTDEISLRPPQIDKDRIDSLFEALNNDPTAQVYIIDTFKKTEALKNVERKFSKIFTFLKVSKFPLEKVSFVIYFGENNLTEFWITPKGAPLPPNVDESSIQINAKTYKKDLAKIFAQKRKKN